jgi:hypothetical protein
LEAIKSEPLTIAEIVDRFGCVEGTARTWVKHTEVEKVPGSWPTAYIRKDSLVPTGRMPATENQPKPNNVLRYDIPNPPADQKEKFFRAVLAAEAGTLVFVDEFRAADSQKDLLVLINKLKTALVVTDYYLELMKKDGTP